MADQEPIIEIKIYQDDEDTSRLKARGSSKVPVNAIFMPLAILVERMIDVLDENPDATMRDVGITMKSREEEDNV